MKLFYSKLNKELNDDQNLLYYTLRNSSLYPFNPSYISSH